MDRDARAWRTLTIGGVLGVLALLICAAGARAVNVPPGSLAQRSNLAGLTNAQYMDNFVVRDGSQLSVDNVPFRWNGANVEWLGLENYGPNTSTQIPVNSERYPTKYEIDDALATAHDMGETVIRVQTLGDSVGCSLCEEPTLGAVNEKAFAATDLLVAQARKYGIKLIGEFDGDANGSKPTSTGTSLLQWESQDWYCHWAGVLDCGLSFFSDARLIAEYEAHMTAVLDHVNPYTGLAYRDDPTIMGWVDGNNLGLFDTASPTSVVSWMTTVSAYFKSLDAHQLFIDNSVAGDDAGPLPFALKVPDVDVFAQEYYPHWFPVIDGDRIDGTVTDLPAIAKTVAAAGKAYSVFEYGWDHTNFQTPAALDEFEDTLVSDQNIAGSNYWALAAHAPGHGWQAIPANADCSPTCESLEDGNWWALYYTGLTTASNTADDMANRAQILRQYAYRIDGFSSTPAHEIVPAPIITSVGATGLVSFEGSAGAPDYSVQRLVSTHRRVAGTAHVKLTHSWSTPCSQCTVDADNGWQDPTHTEGCYRVVPVNLADIPGPASVPAGRGCPRDTARLTSTAKTNPRPTARTGRSS